MDNTSGSTNTNTKITTPSKPSTSKIAATKRTYKKLDFSFEEEEQLIEFVKDNPALYDPKDIQYKNKNYRDRLYNDFGATIEKSGKIFAVAL